MDRARDLIEEHDLTPEEFYIRRRAEFDWWFDLPDVRLYEAVMLSVRIIPQSYYRLEEKRVASHLPRYPDEFWFRLDRPDFHDRMVLAVAAVRTGALRSTADTYTLNESECRITFEALERWANKAKLPLPAEWRRQNVEPAEAASQQVREQNNLLRIIRALIRAAGISDGAALGDVVTRARLISPIEPEIVVGVFHAVAWEDKNSPGRPFKERKAMRSWSDNADLIGIIAALICLRKLKIDTGSKKGGPKRIDRLVNDDLRARGDPTATVPKIDTIEGVFKRACAALSDMDDVNPT